MRFQKDWTEASALELSVLLDQLVRSKYHAEACPELLVTTITAPIGEVSLNHRLERVPTEVIDFSGAIDTARLDGSLGAQYKDRWTHDSIVIPIKSSISGTIKIGVLVK